MSDQTRTVAKVQLTIEIETNSSWGPDCSTRQVFQQAQDEAIGRVRNAFGAINKGVRLVGIPTVTAVTYTKD